MYAFIMSNVGLMVRERMGIVYIGYLLGMLSWAPREALRRVRTSAPAAASPRAGRAPAAALGANRKDAL